MLTNVKNCSWEQFSSITGLNKKTALSIEKKGVSKDTKLTIEKMIYCRQKTKLCQKKRANFPGKCLQT